MSWSLILRIIMWNIYISSPHLIEWGVDYASVWHPTAPVRSLLKRRFWPIICEHLLQVGFRYLFRIMRTLSRTSEVRVGVVVEVNLRQSLLWGLFSVKVVFGVASVMGAALTSCCVVWGNFTTICRSCCSYNLIYVTSQDKVSWNNHSWLLSWK